MTPYLAIFKARFCILFQNRLAAIAGCATQVFWGYVRTMVFTAFYMNAQGTEPLSCAQSITYIWLCQAFIQILPWNIDLEIKNLIKRGDVAFELIRPVDLYGLWFFRLYAWRIAPTALRALPIFVVSYLFFGMQLPNSISSFVAFSCTLFLSTILATALNTLFTLLLFWYKTGEGILRLLNSFIVFLSGLVIPLPLLPSWFAKIVNILPFRGIFDIPFRLYLEPFSPQLLYSGLLFQVIWIVLIVFLGRSFLHKAIRGLSIHGG